MAVPFSNTKLRVPKGFQNILEAFAREVLRSQPENIHEFAAAYFENMMKVRVETGHDPAVHGAKLDDRNYNNDGFKKKPSTITEQQQNNAAVAIQTQYRQHEAKAEVEELRREQAAIKIQSGFRGHVDREQVRKMRDKHSTKKVEEIDIDLNDPEVQKAAAFIQSGFKGFKVRKQATDEEKSSSSKESIHQHAATKIQAQYRGHLIRKQMRQLSGSMSPSHDKGSKDYQNLKDSSERDLSNNRVSVDHADDDAGDAVVDQMQFDDDSSQAAVKIQAGFRGYKVRKQLKGGKAEETEDLEEDEQDDHQEDKDVADDEAGVGDEFDLSNPEAEQAAIKIQAGFKGFKVRKELHEKHARGSLEEATPRDQEDVEVGGVDQHVDLDDPDMETAAVKIQAGFKGMKARREVKAMLSERRQGESHDLEEVSEREIQDNDEQAGDRAQEIDADDVGETAGVIGDETIGDDQVTDEPAGEDLMTDEVTVDEQTAEETAGDDQVTDEPATDDQVTDEPTGNDEVTDEPTGDDQGTDEVTGDDQVTDEPTANDQETDEPTANDQDTDEPTAEEPTTEDQVTEDLESQDLFS